MYEKLFSPLKIRELELKNRVVLPAMGTRMATADGEVTDRLIAYHAARAAGGCGLNIVEVAAVHKPSAPAYFVSIAEDALTEGHKRLTDAIHEAGGRAGLQLWQGSIAAVMDARQKAQLLVASDMEFYGKSLKGIEKEVIAEIVDCYAKAAGRSVKAGYDCLEFHCAHNYLPHSFLSGGFNHREDEYGGSFENRARFPLEVIKAIRAEMPAGMPLLMRIDAMDDYLQGGLSIEEVISFCRLAKEAGVDALDVSRGNIITAASMYEVPPVDVPRGFNVENAARIKQETGMVTIAVGRINQPAQAEEILAAGKADMVVMGRAQLADAEFCNKAEQGRVEDIVSCVGCNQGCYDGFCDMAHFPHITCLRNPELGRECENLVKPADGTKRVFIAGGGMGGMEAAVILKKRGHSPELYEKGRELGGQFLYAGMAPGKGEMKEAAVSFGAQVQKAGIPVYLGQELTAEIIREEKPDAVIVAAGASPVDIKLPGMELKPCCQANEVLCGQASPKGKVCVIGGGLVGLEAADMLAEQGCSVSVLEMKPAIGADLGSLRKIAVMQKMAVQKVEQLANTTCEAITEEGVQVKQEDGTRVIPCDWVVMAVGAKANDTSALTEACEEMGIPVAVIGDAKQARRALNAVAEGFAAAIAI